MGMTRIEANDPETRSPNVVADNVEQLKALFPDAFTEGKVDFDVLKQLLGGCVDESEEKYGLNWHGKRQARQLALTPSTGTLRPCPEESVDWDTTQNLMIEGDNLEVLKLLQKSYAGKVKLIYIDPPYNTGKDFIYPDNYRDGIKNYLELTGQVDGKCRKISTNFETSGRFHTAWLSMMYPRLRLAHQLLRDDGLIFVNIDDGESSNLRMMMAEVFGGENFLSLISWEKRYTRSNNAKLFYSLKDTLVCFRKSAKVSILREIRSPNSKRIYSNPDSDPRGEWTSSSYVNPATKDQRPSLVYPIENSNTGKMINHPTHAWKYKIEEHQRHIREGLLWWGKAGKAKYPRLKNFLSEMREGVVPVDLWDYGATGTTDEGGDELKDLFGEAVFPNPKPTRLIDRVTTLAESTGRFDDGRPIVLDFFAGSATTGHAVMKSTSQEYRYILVQFPEALDAQSGDHAQAVRLCDHLGRPRNVAEITKGRLRRAGRKVKQAEPNVAADLGFRVFKLDTSNLRTWEPRPKDLETSLLQGVDHIKPDRTEDDILYEVLLKLGIDLCVPVEEREIAGKIVRSVGAGTLIACLAEGIGGDDAETLALGIAAWHTELSPAGDSTVIFRDSAFEDDVAKANVAAILEQHGIKHVRSI